jgi:uridine kinase
LPEVLLTCLDYKANQRIFNFVQNTQANHVHCHRFDICNRLVGQRTGVLQWAETTKDSHLSAKRPIIIGVAGGTASGKTTVSQQILETVGTNQLAYIEHDSYYRDLSHLPLEERKEFNFDHPNSLENELLVAHLKTLLQGQPVQVPVYNFAQYIRTNELRQVEPRRVIMVEGILIFVDRELRDLMDVKIYVDAPPDLRFIRRLKRDVVERGRTVNHVIEQYLETVRPMHLEFVEPSKRHADVIIPRGGRNIKAIQMVVAQIERMLAEANKAG